MMTGWSSTKFVIFVPIAYPRWPPQGNNSLLLDPMRISFKDFYKPLGLEISILNIYLDMVISSYNVRKNTEFHVTISFLSINYTEVSYPQSEYTF